MLNPHRSSWPALRAQFVGAVRQARVVAAGVRTYSVALRCSFYRSLPIRRRTTWALVALAAGCAMPEPQAPPPPEEATFASRAGDGAAGERIGPRRGDYEFAVQGLALTPDFDKGGAKGELAFGYYVSDAASVGLRQFASYREQDHDRSYLATRVAADLGFTWHRVRPSIGASLGYAYGESVNETMLIGGQLGIKVYLQSATFVQLLGVYDQYVTTTEDHSEIFGDHATTLSLGIGLNF